MNSTIPAVLLFVFTAACSSGDPSASHPAPLPAVDGAHGGTPPVCPTGNEAWQPVELGPVGDACSALYTDTATAYSDASCSQAPAAVCWPDPKQTTFPGQIDPGFRQCIADTGDINDSLAAAEVGGTGSVRFVVYENVLELGAPSLCCPTTLYCTP
jgi:hypothetical protein